MTFKKDRGCVYISEDHIKAIFKKVKEELDELDEKQKQERKCLLTALEIQVRRTLWKELPR